MAVLAVVSLCDGADDEVGGLEIVVSLGVLLFDADVIIDVLMQGVGVDCDVVDKGVHGFDSGRTLVEGDEEVVVVAAEDSVGKELGEIVIDEVFGLALAEKFDFRFVDNEIENVDVSLRDKMIQEVLALGEGEVAGLDFSDGGESATPGNMQLSLADKSTGALHALRSIKNGCRENEIFTSTTEIA